MFAFEISVTQIDLIWTDNSFDETGFTIERSEDNNSNFVVLTTVCINVTTYIDNTVIPGKGYFYRIIANGAPDSNPSNVKFASTISPPGNVLDFDGVDDMVIIPDNDDLDFGSGDFTIECWFKPNTLTDGRRYLVAKDLAGERQFEFQFDRNFTGNVKNLTLYLLMLPF